MRGWGIHTQNSEWGEIGTGLGAAALSLAPALPARAQAGPGAWLGPPFLLPWPFLASGLHPPSKASGELGVEDAHVSFPSRGCSSFISACCCVQRGLQFPCLILKVSGVR